MLILEFWNSRELAIFGNFDRNQILHIDPLKLRTSQGHNKTKISEIGQFLEGIIGNLLFTLNVQTPCKLSHRLEILAFFLKVNNNIESKSYHYFLLPNNTFCLSLFYSYAKVPILRNESLPFFFFLCKLAFFSNLFF